MTSITLPPGGDTEQLRKVHALCRSELNRYGLAHWHVAFDRSHNRAGQCQRSKRTISLSAPLMSIWRLEDARDTILHEIAHALTSGGHNDEWRRMCKRIGADPSRCWGDNGEARIQGKYVGRCPNGHVLNRERETKKMYRISCGRCSPSYDEQYKFTWTKTRLVALAIDHSAL